MDFIKFKQRLNKQINVLDIVNVLICNSGKGRGRQVISTARTADLVIIMLDATKGEIQRSRLKKIIDQ